MIITITGPRSVGKTKTSKIVARKLNLKYVSSDEIGEKAFKKYGGLDKAMKSGKALEVIKNGGYRLILNEYDKDDFVFDLSGGSVRSGKLAKASSEVRKVAKKSSIVFGLLPFKNRTKSVKLLFEREQKREHFKGMDKIELLKKTKETYLKFPPIFEKFCDHIIYTKENTPTSVANEIVKKIKERK